MISGSSEKIARKCALYLTLERGSQEICIISDQPDDSQEICIISDSRKNIVGTYALYLTQERR
jgi:hypothetical protein